MIDGLQGLGLRLLAEGHSTPLLNIANAYMYATIQEAFEAIDRVGRYNPPPLQMQQTILL